MPLLMCRGHEKRKRICKEYIITPVAHIIHLDNQTVKSCAGGDISDSYFVFHAQKNNNDYKIVCGYPTARDFCEILNKKLPTIFNPFIKDQVIIKEKNIKPNETESQKINWNNTMLQLTNAIMLLMTYLSYREESVLTKILKEIKPYPDKEPFIKYIKAVNTILHNNNLTISKLITRLSNISGDIKGFTFENLAKRLKENNIENYFI